jgi:cytochrome c
MRRGLMVLSLLLGASPATAQEDLVAAGESEFLRCKKCHNATATATVVKKGPHLHDLFGRKPGGLPGFEYSEAMVKFGEDKVWNEATLATFLRNPSSAIPGNKMEFNGVEKDDELRALLAYLATLDPQGTALQ